MDMGDKNEGILGALKYIAGQVGVDLGGGDVSIATDKKCGRARTYDGLLEVTVYSSEVGVVEVESMRGQGVYVKLLDQGKKGLEPLGAILEIGAYTKGAQGNETLNGDVYLVYVGKNGIILSDAGGERAAKLYEKDVGKRGGR